MTPPSIGLRKDELDLENLHSGLWLEGRLCSILTLMLGGDLDPVRVRVSVRVIMHSHAGLIIRY